MTYIEKDDLLEEAYNQSQAQQDDQELQELSEVDRYYKRSIEQDNFIFNQIINL